MRGKATRTTVVQEPAPGYNESAIAIYETPDGVCVDVKLEKETLWLTQKQMSELFRTERSVITKHLRNIFKSGELIQDSVCANFALTAVDGKAYSTAFYNLDAVISVGYRGVGMALSADQDGTLVNELSAAGADYITHRFPELPRLVDPA